MIIERHEFESRRTRHDWPDFIRTDDCRARFRVTLSTLKKSRKLRPEMLPALGLTRKDYLRVRLTHGSAKEREMDNLIGYLTFLQDQRNGLHI